MKLFLQPEDVWLFRDGRPFSAGSDHRAQSLFPPLPSTLQGMLRSYHLVRKNVDLTSPQAVCEAVGTASRYPPGFRLRGPFLAREEGEGTPRRIWRYLPLPEDAVGSQGRFRALVPSEPPGGVLTSNPLPRLLWDRGDPVKREGEWWLREDELARYLDGREVQAVAATSLFMREPRFGIGQVAARRTVQQGMLYEVEYIRPCDGVGLVVEVEGLDGWPAQGHLSAGGERRSARFRQVTLDPLPAPSRPLPGRFKLYLATPTYLSDGWQPLDWRPYLSPPVWPVAAAIGRYRTLGGFDLARRSDDAPAHKPARRYVPAGSVYFFEAQKDDASLLGDTISDDPAPIGWGQVLVGKW